MYTFLKLLFFVAAFLFLAKPSFAQSRELSGIISIEVPQGDLGTIYPSAPLFLLSYSGVSKFKKKWNSFGVSLGFMAMLPRKPVYDYFVEIDNVVSVGKATYSTYKSYQLMANLKTGRMLNPLLGLFWGTDIGFNLTSYDYSLKSNASNDEGSQNTTRIVLAPKFGFNISINKSFHLNPQIRYVFSIGENNNEASILNRYLSIGAEVGFRF
jgi:hypothetical protein